MTAEMYGKTFLQNSQATVTKIAVENAPVTVEQFNQYDAVILSDVSIESMPSGFLDALESYVKTTGGGLLGTKGILVGRGGNKSK